MLVLIENELLHSALLLDGVNPRNMKSVVVMKVVNSKKNGFEFIKIIILLDQIIKVVY